MDRIADQKIVATQLLFLRKGPHGEDRSDEDEDIQEVLKERDQKMRREADRGNRFQGLVRVGEVEVTVESGIIISTAEDQEEGDDHEGKRGVKEELPLLGHESEDFPHRIPFSKRASS
jgi:hypothetical protein